MIIVSRPYDEDDFEHLKEEKLSDYLALYHLHELENMLILSESPKKEVIQRAIDIMKERD